jgi:hypothetical protein
MDALQNMAPELTVKTMPWHKSKQEIVAMLAFKNARAAQAGRPCPIAERALDRLMKVKEG